MRLPERLDWAKALAALGTYPPDYRMLGQAYRDLADAIKAGDPDRARTAAHDLLEPATTGLLTAIENLREPR